MQHMKLSLPEGFDPNTQLWYVYAIHSEAVTEGSRYMYIGCTRWIMHRVEAHSFNCYAKKLQVWMNDEVNAGRIPRVSILATAKTKQKGFALEKKMIRLHQPPLNTKHTHSIKQHAKRGEIDVDCHWDKKYWIDPGDDPFT